MKKQEAIEKIKELKPDEQNLHEYQPEEWEAFEDGFFDAKTYAELIIEELDEPEKVVVPPYIDTWIQGAEYNGFDLYEAMTDESITDDETPDKVNTWIADNPETFAKAWLYGYEVEEEKLYTVKFSNEDFGKIYIGIFKKVNKLGISSLPLNDDDVKSWFTEDELERFKFWNNPAFEIKEVTE